MYVLQEVHIEPGGRPTTYIHEPVCTTSRVVQEPPGLSSQNRLVVQL